MSRIFGDIRQVAYLVPDIEAAMDHWARVLGVGPWYYNPKVPIKNYRYKGESHEPHNSVALANSGFIQVELIQTRNDVPSMYQDFRKTSKSGLPFTYTIYSPNILRRRTAPAPASCPQTNSI